jgi:hypothetical protein
MLLIAIRGMGFEGGGIENGERYSGMAIAGNIVVTRDYILAFPFFPA